MSELSLTKIVENFNVSINKRNRAKLAEYMSEDYIFIDSANNMLVGKSMNLKSWESFFNQFPDYENVFEEYIESNNQVVIIGYSKCSNKMLDGKAIWLAEFDENKKIKKWQVFNDNIENRKSLKIA